MQIQRQRVMILARAAIVCLSLLVLGGCTNSNQVTESEDQTDAEETSVEESSTPEGQEDELESGEESSREFDDSFLAKELLGIWLLKSNDYGVSPTRPEHSAKLLVEMDMVGVVRFTDESATESKFRNGELATTRGGKSDFIYSVTGEPLPVTDHLPAGTKKHRLTVRTLTTWIGTASK